MISHAGTASTFAAGIERGRADVTSTAAGDSSSCPHAPFELRESAKRTREPLAQHAGRSTSVGNRDNELALTEASADTSHEREPMRRLGFEDSPSMT